MGAIGPVLEKPALLIADVIIFAKPSTKSNLGAYSNLLHQLLYVSQEHSLPWRGDPFPFFQRLHSQPLLSVGGVLAAHLIEMLADLIPQIWFQVIYEQE